MLSVDVREWSEADIEKVAEEIGERLLEYRVAIEGLVDDEVEPPLLKRVREPSSYNMVNVMWSS